MSSQDHDLQSKIDSLQAQIDALQAEQASLFKQAKFEKLDCRQLIEAKHIAIVGGAGRLGKLFVRLFAERGHQVTVIEANDWDNLTTTLADVDLVIVSVPINATETVIHQLAPHLTQHTILADVTSVKSKPLAAMMEAHSGAVVGLHPMFGPDTDDLDDQVIVHCEGRGIEQYQWLLDDFKQQGAKLHSTTAESHDKAMAFIQVMRHFTTFVYGLHLQQEDPSLQELITISSPIYRLELAMVGRLFAQDAQLYADIIFANQDNFDLLKRYMESYSKGIELLEQGCKDEFKREFNDVTQWFGDFAEHFLDESHDLLEAAHHTVKKRNSVLWD